MIISRHDRSICILPSGNICRRYFLSSAAVPALLVSVLILDYPAEAFAAEYSDSGVEVEKTHKYEKRSARRKMIPGFPAVPRYPGAVVNDSYVKTEGEKVGYDTTYVVDAPVPKVIKFYLAELRKQGWEILAPPDDPISKAEQTIKARRGNQILFVIAEKEDQHTEIAVEFPMHVPGP